MVVRFSGGLVSVVVWARGARAPADFVIVWYGMMIAGGSCGGVDDAGMW